MRIREIIPTLQAEKALSRTPIGRPITEYAKATIDAALSDEKNYEIDAMKCLNCCIIVSGLLCADGCPNCGSKDITLEITPKDIL